MQKSLTTPPPPQQPPRQQRNDPTGGQVFRSSFLVFRSFGSFPTQCRPKACPPVGARPRNRPPRGGVTSLPDQRPVPLSARRPPPFPSATQPGSGSSPSEGRVQLGGQVFRASGSFPTQRRPKACPPVEARPRNRPPGGCDESPGPKTCPPIRAPTPAVPLGDLARVRILPLRRSGPTGGQVFRSFGSIPTQRRPKACPPVGARPRNRPPRGGRVSRTKGLSPYPRANPAGARVGCSPLPTESIGFQR
jgi:hypothetical protein